MAKFLVLVLLLNFNFLFSQIPTSGLIYGWPFTGNANDMSGNNNNGTVYNATLTTDRFGASNCAYNFNGSSSYIVMQNAGPIGGASRSVSFWLQTTSSSHVSAFAYGDGLSTPGSLSIHLNYYCNGVGMDMGNGAYTRSFPNIINGQWHHVVAVYNSATATSISSFDFYVDGVLVSSNCWSVNPGATLNTNATFPVTIGKTSDGYIRFFNGKLDDFYMYDRPLTPSEVTQLYNYSPCSSGPSAPTGISGNSTLCSGASYTYSVGSVSGATSYSWSVPGGWSVTSAGNIATVTPNANSGAISVIAINPCGQSSPVSINVTSNPSPTLALSALSTTICKGNSTSLYASGASTYTWSTGSGSASITVSPSVSTVYTVSGQNSFGCNATLTKTITVTNNTLPTIILAGPGGFSCPGQSINLAASGANTYTWEPGSLTGFYVTVTPGVTTTYTVTGTNANGCYNSSTYTQSVSICDGITGSDPAENFSLQLFPNPTNNLLYVISSESSELTVTIENTLGQTILSEQFKNKTVFNLSSMDMGVYSVSVYKNGVRVYTRKLVKN